MQPLTRISVALPLGTAALSISQPLLELRNSAHMSFGQWIVRKVTHSPSVIHKNCPWIFSCFPSHPHLQTDWRGLRGLRKGRSCSISGSCFLQPLASPAWYTHPVPRNTDQGWVFLRQGVSCFNKTEEQEKKQKTKNFTLWDSPSPRKRECGRAECTQYSLPRFKSVSLRPTRQEGTSFQRLRSWYL